MFTFKEISSCNISEQMYTSIVSEPSESLNNLNPNFMNKIFQVRYITYHLKDSNSLKLPSLFAAWLFWTFYTKSHNMKELVILSHLWSLFLYLTCLHRKNELLWVSVWLSGVFSWEKTPLRLLMQTTWPWPPVGSFSHGLITVRQKKMWT